VLCGRATWQDGVAAFVKGGMSGLEDWLGRDGVANIENVNRALETAQPWFSDADESRAGKAGRSRGKGRP